MRNNLNEKIYIIEEQGIRRDMKVLVVGSGGREHAITWSINKSKKIEKIFVAPGNGGTKEIAENVSLDTSNHDEVVKFCKDKDISLVIIGPEAELVAGLSDALNAEGIRVFGPSKAAAILEASKDYTKKFCTKYNIPTAAFDSFTEAGPAKEYVKKIGTPIVVKADGLAAGKGVIIAANEQEAFDAIDEIFGGKFGSAGSIVVIEEFLEGEELSFFALLNGEKAIALASAQDHKAVGEGDTGPNTGGMGTYSPAPVMDNKLQQQIMDDFIIPTAKGMVAEDRSYTGIIFAGFMITAKGPMLLEYNVRFGDPETQSVLSRLETDLVDLIEATIDGNFDNIEVKLSDKAALCVVMAAKGYPNSYQKNTEIKNIDKVSNIDNINIFHAGTKEDSGKILANGGRVLGVTAIGNSIIEAQKKAYNAVDNIDWEDGFCRRDIGWRAIKREEKNAS